MGDSAIPKRLLGAVCLALLSGLLVAGWLPFKSPANGATLRSGQGLVYRRYSIASGTADLTPDQNGKGPCSVELLIRPSSEESHTILAFYTPSRPEGFLLRQSNTDVTLSRRINGVRVSYAEASNVLRKGQRVHLAVAAGPSGTRIYVNGAQAAYTPKAAYSREDLKGQMLLGNSARQHDSFQGEISGLAIYDSELSPAQALEHFRSWDRARRPEIGPDEKAASLYLFDRPGPEALRNQIQPRQALNIPARYFVPEHLFLERPWDDFRMDWPYAKDAIVNVGGFIPFGVVVRLYLSLTVTKRRAWFLSALTGAVVSLVIETVQYFLPTRDSTLTDVLNNALGAAVGAGIAPRLESRTPAVVRVAFRKLATWPKRIAIRAWSNKLREC